MAVDLSELVPSLKREVNPPGADLYPAVTNTQWAGYLQDAFWEARLDGLFTAWTLNDDGEVVPVSTGGADLDRQWQQLLVLYAGFRITLNRFTNLKSQFRAQAGPVSFEQGQSATTLKGVLDAIRERMKRILDTTISGAAGGGVYVFDSVIERSYNLAVGDAWFVS